MNALGRKTIAWLNIAMRGYGGFVYGEKVRDILCSDFNVELKDIKTKGLKWRYLKPVGWFFGFLKIDAYKDLWIRDDLYSMAMFPFSRTRGKNLVMIYHIDSSVVPFLYKPVHFLLEKMFYHMLKKADAIVTISEYWENYFLERGYSNVYKAYPGFNLSEYKIGEDEVSEFKKKFNLGQKPIIYIGNCQKMKGVVESYNALKNLSVHLVTSGERRVKIPALNLNLKHRDYLKLLKASSIVITMSKFKEGWCMTAHEGMLLKTPVIGSGLGGMHELLEGGKQIICQDFNSLLEKVNCILGNPEIKEKMGEDGYNFAKSFTIEKFKENWIKVTKKVLNGETLS